MYGAIADWLVIGVGTAMAVRAVCKPAVARELREVAALAVALLFSVGAATVVAGWIATSGPAPRRVLALAVAAVTGLAWLRARPAYGQSRGLPPGSLGLGVSLDAVSDERFHASASQRWGPVFKVSQLHHRVVCITNLRDARQLMEHEGAAVRQVRWPNDRLVKGGYVEFMDGKRHQEYRARLAPRLAPDRLARYRPAISEVLRRGIEDMARASGSRDVAPRAHVERMATLVVLQAIAGIGPDDSRATAFLSQFPALDRPVHPLLPVPAAKRNAFGSLCRMLREAGAGDDDTVAGNLAMMLVDGRNMMRMTLAWITRLAAEHPNLLAEIRTSPDQDSRGTLASRFVLEVLRTRMTPYIYRRTVAECRIRGFRIPPGWLVRVCLREAHHDPDVFSRPDEFDPSRFAAREYGQEEFWPWSAGVHTCMADRFVMMTAVEYVSQLAATDIRLTTAGPAERANRHWAYTIPSNGDRVRVSRMAEDPFSQTVP